MTTGTWIIPVCLLPCAGVILMLLISQQEDKAKLRNVLTRAQISATVTTQYKNKTNLQIPTVTRLSKGFSFRSRADEPLLPPPVSSESRGRMRHYSVLEQPTLPVRLMSPLIHSSSSLADVHVSRAILEQDDDLPSCTSGTTNDYEEELLTPATYGAFDLSKSESIKSRCREESPTRGLVSNYAGSKRVLSAIPEVYSPQYSRPYKGEIDDDGSLWKPSSYTPHTHQEFF